ncbi:hypothetical protein TB2_018487 [Malus domestica]
MNPGLGTPRCPRCLSLLDHDSEKGEWTITHVLHDAKSKVAAVGGDEVLALSTDVIILDVGRMTCGGCVASVNEGYTILAKEVMRANQLTSYGFKSNLHVAGQGATKGDISPSECKIFLFTAEREKRFARFPVAAWPTRAQRKARKAMAIKSLKSDGLQGHRTWVDRGGAERESK